MSERIYDHLCDGFRQSIERMFATNFSRQAMGVSEMYNRFGMFCQEYYDMDDRHQSIDTERNILVNVMRAMRYGASNARLQFPRILKLPHLINMELVREFNQEVMIAITHVICTQYQTEIIPF